MTARTIAYYTDSVGFGGSEQVLLTVLNCLNRAKWNPVFIHHGGTGLTPFVDKVKETGTRVESFRLPRRKDISWLLDFGRLLRDLRADVFHAHLISPLACTHGVVGAGIVRIPRVATQHLYWEPETNRSVRLQKVLSLLVDRFVAVSEHVARELRRDVLRPGTVQVVPNGIHLDPFQSAADPAFRLALTGGTTNRPIVLTLARLWWRKGLNYLLEAAALVPQAMFVVAGEGPERELLETQARDAGIAARVVFLGQRDDIPRLLAACDVFVLPSLFEGLPLSVLEAMAAGKPVIATDVGGTAEAVIEGRTGLLVPPRDPLALASALSTVLNDRNLAAEFGRAGRLRATNEFSAEKMTLRNEAIYEDVLARSRRARRLSRVSS
jgi:glycosyltransferase involved in cell wall biosynthesis